MVLQLVRYRKVIFIIFNILYHDIDLYFRPIIFYSKSYQVATELLLHLPHYHPDMVLRVLHIMVGFLKELLFHLDQLLQSITT